MGLFKTTNMFGVAMAAQVKELLSSYNLLYKLITYVKDEGGNLSTLARALTFMVSCHLLALVVLWQGSCCGHAFSKTCQYAYNDINVCVGFREVSLKATQAALHKTITWIKNLAKGEVNGRGHALMLGSPIEN
jgi:hypothetical protein